MVYFPLVLSAVDSDSFAASVAYSRPTVMGRSKCSSTSKGLPRCGCNETMKLWVSNTFENPSRKFWKCRNFMNGCGLFLWDDMVSEAEVNSSRSNLTASLNLSLSSFCSRIAFHPSTVFPRPSSFFLHLLLPLYLFSSVGTTLNQHSPQSLTYSSVEFPADIPSRLRCSQQPTTSEPSIAAQNLPRNIYFFTISEWLSSNSNVHFILMLLCCF
ncbi:unnamed protein product [Vicia faba]|uniref:GRF-type domain-containing protein n=1 Tax=Vicia faba TaxID=3906 RepID=A0AAV1A9W4_VICFA|nr:unnamed protein product [Vicia faba]